MLTQVGYPAAPNMPPTRLDFVSPYLRRPLRPLEEVERNRGSRSGKRRPDERETDRDDREEDRQEGKSPKR